MKNVQTLVTPEAHKALILEALDRNIPLWELLQEIIKEHLEGKQQQEKGEVTNG